MGFLFGGKKAKEAEEPAAKVDQPASRRSVRKVVAGGAKTGQQPAPAGGAKPPTQSITRTSGPAAKPAPAAKSGPIAKPGSSPVSKAAGFDPEASAPSSRPAPAAPVPAVEPDHLDLGAPAPAAAPQRRGTQPITASQPPAFTGALGGPVRSAVCRTGDAALIDFLVGKASLISSEQAQALKSKAEADGEPLDVAGVKLSLFTEDQLVSQLTQECWVPHLKVDKYEIRKKALDTVGREDAVHYGVFPVDKLGSLLTLAMVNPLDAETIRVLEQKTGLDIKKVVATRSEIQQGIEKYYSGQVQAKEGSLAFTQDVEPKSVTTMMAKVEPSAPPSSAPIPVVSSAAAPGPDVVAEIQDIDDLLASDEAIAPAIIEPIALKPEMAEVESDGADQLDPALTRSQTRPVPELDLSDTQPIKPEAPSIAPEFELGDHKAGTGALARNDKGLADEPELNEPAIAAPKTASAQKPPAAAGAPRPATARFTSKDPGRLGLVNLIPVMEEEFQHAITHGKSHVFEKWVGLQSRNRIINAVAVESELETVLAGLYQTPRQVA